MDSNSDSFDNMPLPKIELEAEPESPTHKKEVRYNWNTESTMKLIETMEKECKELWDVKHPANKDRAARQARMEYLAGIFDTTLEEISRKIHNLRSQFNNEVRKIRKRTGGLVAAGISSWDYFDALSFLLRTPPDPLDVPLVAPLKGVNLALAEFQAEEEVAFGRGGRMSQSPRILMVRNVCSSSPNPLPQKVWNEEPVILVNQEPRPDDCQVFGDFVASQLRQLPSQEARSRLMQMIQKAVLQVAQEETEVAQEEN
ncbi:PREDICTED: uncharacterized protein LOC106128285 [Papilio xuthus]|uniref:Uncharacterized protein LOC106128285 n=1 Tax=Papilio xuthus TaxID=66420 RepID=A0AAJ6ZYI2_PAPXU|nr:PREDICTED: uncharacterized protein LOC106128285 [Papilio xuthus]